MQGPLVQIRRFDGPRARELFLVLRPDASLPSFAGQTESIYGAMATALAAEGCSGRDVLRETVFFGGIQPDVPGLLDARRRALRTPGSPYHEPATLLVGQPSVSPSEQLIVAAWAMIERGAGEVRDVFGTPPCACDACSRVHARARVADGEKQLWSGNLYGSPGDTFDEATDMFRAAGELLAQEDMDFRSVVRTWIYLRDIERDYAELNRARRSFFRRAGVTVYPASTGIGGRPWPARHKLSMSFHAFRPRNGDVPHPMTTPTLNEACRYGSDFSRGMCLPEANKVSLHVSGTASVDESGRTAHPGDFDAQVRRMLLNLSTLLERDGATLGDTVSAITYLKSADMAPRYFEILRENGLGGFPHVVVEAEVCRQDLLCEMEVQAALPPCWPTSPGSGKVSLPTPRSSGS